ncbi:hypothetical protein GCM10027051_29010 [Niabella terrae]
MNQTENLKQEIQDLVNKTIEVNKSFLKEGSALLQQFTTKDTAAGSRQAKAVFQSNLLSQAINAYATLNIRHLKNMMDLGMELTRQAVKTAGSATTTADEEETAVEPSFILQQSVKAGSSTRFQFVMDNDKSEAVTVQLIHSAYRPDVATDAGLDFPTVFKPARFVLDPGAEQRVDLRITVPKKTAAGTYTAQVQVSGFEPAYFRIQLDVT